MDLRVFQERRVLKERTDLKVNEERLAHLAPLEVLVCPASKATKANKETTESQDKEERKERKDQGDQTGLEDLMENLVRKVLSVIQGLKEIEAMPVLLVPKAFVALPVLLARLVV